VRLRVVAPRRLGEHVRLGEPGPQAVGDVGQLDGDVQQDRPDDDVGQVVVHPDEVPRPRVPAEDVEEPGEQLQQ
jgi:hypothetical protein